MRSCLGHTVRGSCHRTLSNGFGAWERSEARAAITISGNIDGQFAKFAFERLLALAVSSVAPCIGNRLVFVVPQMLRHLSFEGTFDLSFSPKVCQAILNH